MVEPGWHPDPRGSHEHRFHDGNRWTAHVSDRGRVGIDGSGSERSTATRPRATPVAAGAVLHAPPAGPWVSARFVEKPRVGGLTWIICALAIVVGAGIVGVLLDGGALADSHGSATGDVVITSCLVNSLGRPEADGAITNHSGAVSSYVVTIGFQRGGRELEQASTPSDGVPANAPTAFVAMADRPVPGGTVGCNVEGVTRVRNGP
ncbi:MAG TPA: DUF2510 domain-containing protein [Acidimicrobiia bacterium]|jgi:hypothetical protein